MKPLPITRTTDSKAAFRAGRVFRIRAWPAGNGWPGMFALALLLAATVACAGDGGVEQRAWQEIRGGALLVDVRTPREYAAGHLEGALLIPYDQVKQRLVEFGEDKGRSIVLYCRSGRRAGVAERILREAGFTNVLNAGGYEAMRAAQRHRGAES